MLRLMFLVVFSFLGASALSGCSTVLLIDAATETVTEKYVVDGADGAWLGENGDLTVCLYGQAPRRPSADFAVFIAAGDFAVSDTVRPLAAYRIPPDRIAARCDQPPEGAREIPVEFVGAVGDSGPQEEQYWQPAPDQEQVSEGDLQSGPEGDREPGPEEDQEPTPEGDQEPGPGGDQGLVTTTQYMDRDDSGAKIYLFDEPGSDFGATVIYRHETPLPRGARFTRLDLPMTESRPNEALFLLVPVTVAVDIVLIVGYVYLCSQAPGSC